MADEEPTESSVGAPEDLLVCKKTGQTMTWDEAHCPNKGKPCGYRGECQIQVVLDELKDSEDPAKEDPARDPG